MSAREKTMHTAVDAYVCKKSATSLGYYDDKYLEAMCGSLVRNSVRKQPIINRGYYTRVACFRQIVKEFLSETRMSGPRQIVNIGCGYDTLSFHMLDEGYDDLVLYEVDYEEVILRKTDLIRRSPELRERLGGVENVLAANYGFETDKVKFVAVDLQQSNVVDALALAGLASGHSTLIISECVLVYMNASCVSQLCSSLVSYFDDTPVAWISYDMINPFDPFGKMMRSNIELAGGYRIPGFTDFPSLEAHHKKFVDAGFCLDTTRVCSMLDAYRFMISDVEKKRLESIERFDEVEEWDLLMGHYSLLLGVRGSTLAALTGLLPPNKFNLEV